MSVITGPFEIHVDTGAAGWVAETSVVLCARTRDGAAMFVLDERRGRLVRLGEVPARSSWRPLALGADRASLLVLDEAGAGRPYRMWLQPFDGGRPRWFDARADGWDRVGAPSPDGRRVAVVSDADNDVGDGRFDEEEPGVAVVSVIEVADGTRRRLWAAAGGWSDETAVSWSPDGSLIAAAYLTDDDLHRWATVVLDDAGTVVQHIADAWILPSPGAAWTGPRHLVCRSDGTPVFVVDVRDGSRRTLGLTRYPTAALGSRFVVRSTAPSDPHRLLTVDENGDDPRPFIIWHRPGVIDFSTSDRPCDIHRTGGSAWFAVAH